jgi:hypothetical protein
MVRQRFLVLYQRWLFTLAKVVGPILLFKGFVSARQYLQYAPLEIGDFVAGALMVLAATAWLCWLWASGECWWSRLRRIRGLRGQALANTRQHSFPDLAVRSKA